MGKNVDSLDIHLEDAFDLFDAVTVRWSGAREFAYFV